MTRRQMALIAAAAAAAAALGLGLAAPAAPVLAGPAVVLGVIAAALAALLQTIQLRAERRHRWTLQKRVAELQHSLAEPAHQDDDAESVGPEEETDSGHPAAAAEYSQLARIHDRLHALETTLGPRR